MGIEKGNEAGKGKSVNEAGKPVDMQVVGREEPKDDYVDLMIRFHKSGEIGWKIPTDSMMLSYLFQLMQTKVNRIFSSMVMPPTKLVTPGQMDKKNFFKKIFTR